MDAIKTTAGNRGTVLKNKYFFHYFCDSRKRTTGDSLHGSLSWIVSVNTETIFFIAILP